jgi:hypothetical protein
MSAGRWKTVKIVTAVIVCVIILLKWPAEVWMAAAAAVVLIFYLSEWVALFLPTWLILVLVALLLAYLWRRLAGRRPETRLGVCLLVAGVLTGLGLPAWGKLQTHAFRSFSGMLTSMETGGFHPDADELTIACSILPGGDVPIGVTVTLTNTTTLDLAYGVITGPLSTFLLFNQRQGLFFNDRQWVAVKLDPGETRRLERPPGLWVLSSQAVAISNWASQTYLVASCSFLVGDRRFLELLGLLLALAGLVCLGVPAYRKRFGST